MFDWLMVWEPARYFGRHEKRYPADDAIGYRYNCNIHGNDLWLRDWSRVQRAIPVEGTMERLSWSQSPQVKFWMDEPRKNLWQRFMEWFHK